MKHLNLKFKNAPAYLIYSEETRRYLTGFHSSFGIFLKTEKTNLYVTDSRYEVAAKAHFAGSDIELFIMTREKSPYDRISEILKNENVDTVAIEGTLTLFEEKKILSSLTDVEFVLENEISLLKMIKSGDEIEKIKNSMRVSSKAFEETLNHVKEGMTEKDLMAVLNFNLFKFGGDSLAFDTIVASGENGAKPHAVPGNRKIVKGDFVTIDFGAKANGYNSDITRTFALGHVSDKQRNVYEIVKKAQSEALKAIGKVKTCGDLDAVARTIISESGYGEFFGHGLGHGVGVDIHEEPRVSVGVSTVLQENMIITIEPGIYIPGEFGLRIEDTVVVKEGGHINLCPLSKDLLIL